MSIFGLVLLLQLFGVILMAGVNIVGYLAQRSPVRTSSFKTEETGLYIAILSAIIINVWALTPAGIINWDNDGISDLFALQWYWVVDGMDLTQANWVLFSGIYMLYLTGGIIVLSPYWHVLMTSADVIHSYTVVTSNTKLDLTPGRYSDASYMIQQPGLYHSQCSELCGSLHGFMGSSLFFNSKEHTDRYTPQRTDSTGT